jgi:hypothetical protein
VKKDLCAYACSSGRLLMANYVIQLQTRHIRQIPLMLSFVDKQNSYLYSIGVYSLGVSVMGSDGAKGKRKMFAARDDFARWRHPFRDGHILMRRDVLQSLAAQALEHLKAEEPSEIGGLLWGNLTSDDSVAVDDSIAITNITFIPPGGPLFNTTDADAGRIGQAIKHSAPAPNLSLLGYFRSHVRDGLQLTPQDQSLIEQQFHYPDAVFLIIRPFDFGICTAGFFFWRGGQLQTDASDLEVPLFSPDILALERQAVADGARIADETEPAPARRVDEKPAIAAINTKATDSEKEKEEHCIVDFLRESIRNSSAEKEAKRRSANPAALAAPPEKKPILPILLISTAAILALLIAGGGVYVAVPILRSRVQSALQPAPAPGIGPQVDRAANGQLNLTWNRNSPKLIRPSSATLIITDGGSVRRLLIDNQQLHSGKIVYLPNNLDVQFQMELNSDSWRKSRTLSESVRVMSVDAERHGRAGRRSNPIVPAPSSGEAGAAGTPETAQSASRKQESATVTRPGRPALVPVIAAGALPASPPGSAASAFVPPRPIQQMMPEMTVLRRFARISVKVGIDEAGRVISADVLVAGAPEDPLLAGIAVSAAKRWRFQPATLNGAPVASDYTIVFAFHPQLGNTAQ